MHVFLVFETVLSTWKWLDKTANDSLTVTIYIELGPSILNISERILSPRQSELML